jgi:two-component system sensor histidine kinase BaeS
VLLGGPIAIAAGASPSVPEADEPMPAPDALVSAREGDATTPAVGRSGATEALVVLVAVDVLFAIFGAVQVVFLFGGADTLAVIGMTYSDYARQGYFQLVGVVALAGLLLLGTHEVMGRTRPFVGAAITLMVLTTVILASAALRLRLYQDAYGWTELRFFVAASIGWLAACVAFAVALVASNRMRWLPHGIAISAIAITLLVTAIGPQAFVMHQNLARALDPSLVPPGGHTGLDVSYGVTLGDDAIPDLVGALDAVPASERTVLLGQLRARRDELEREAQNASPLSWNLARERAREALRALP